MRALNKSPVPLALEAAEEVEELGTFHRRLTISRITDLCVSSSNASIALSSRSTSNGSCSPQKPVSIPNNFSVANTLNVNRCRNLLLPDFPKGNSSNLVTNSQRMRQVSAPQKIQNGEKTVLQRRASSEGFTKTLFLDHNDKGDDVDNTGENEATLTNEFVAGKLLFLISSIINNNM